MSSHPRNTDLRAALAAGLLLCAASVGLLWSADEAADTATVIGGVGLVLAAAFLGLTLLAWRWSARGASYSDIDMGLREDELTVRASIAVDEDAAAI